MVIVKVKKPQAVLFDLCGTAVHETFVEKVLKPYYQVAYKAYFEVNWEKEECQADVKALAKTAARESFKIDVKAEQKEQIEQLAKYAEKVDKSGNAQNNVAYVIYRFHVWFDGFERGKITTPVYSDVAVHIQKWCSAKIKLYIVSNGWAEATKRFMSKTSHGDLTALIADEFDPTIGPLTSAGTFKKILDKIKEKPEEVIFLTKVPAEGKAAKEAGMGVILVITHNKGVDTAKEEVIGEQEIPIARSFTQIEFFD